MRSEPGQEKPLIAPSEYRNMSAHIATLQEQVETLFANLNSLRADLAQSQSQIDPSLQQYTLGPSLQHASVPPRTSINGPLLPPPMASSMVAPHHQPSQSQSNPQRPPFRGPTSVEFNLGVAKSSLQTMGIAPTEDPSTVVTTDVTPSGSPAPEATLHPTKDPIWHISREEALRLVQLYEDEMHEMYPVVSLPYIRAHISSLYTYMEAALRNGFVQPRMPGSDSIDDDDTNILKLILATAMVLEGSGKSHLGTRMWKYVQPAVDALLLGHAGFKGIRMLSLAVSLSSLCTHLRANPTLLNIPRNENLYIWARPNRQAGHV